MAERSGWKVVKIYEDAGISGAKGRDQRPGLDAMMKAVNAKEFDMVASWSVDRLGRSLTDLLSILQGLHEKGVGLFLHQQGLDTSTTAGKAMFQMLGICRVRAGHYSRASQRGARARRANGTKLGRRRNPLRSRLLFPLCPLAPALRPASSSCTAFNPATSRHQSDDQRNSRSRASSATISPDKMSATKGG